MSISLAKMALQNATIQNLHCLPVELSNFAGKERKIERKKQINVLEPLKLRDGSQYLSKFKRHDSQIWTFLESLPVTITHPYHFNIFFALWTMNVEINFLYENGQIVNGDGDFYYFRSFEMNVHCVSNFYNKTFEECRRQYLDLYQIVFTTNSGFNPRNCKWWIIWFHWQYFFFQANTSCQVR